MSHCEFYFLQYAYYLDVEFRILSYDSKTMYNIVHIQGDYFDGVVNSNNVCVHDYVYFFFYLNSITVSYMYNPIFLRKISRRFTKF